MHSMSGTYRALIVGGSGEAGQSAVAAVKRYCAQANRTPEIIATTSRAKDVEGANRTFSKVDLTGDDAFAPVIQALQDQAIDLIVYTPARGNIGFPIASTTEADLEFGMNFSFNPMVELEAKLNPGLIVGYSAFYWMEHLQKAYGSMGYVKKRMEEWAIDAPEKRKMIRAGIFYSSSTRASALFVKRRLKKETGPDIDELRARIDAYDGSLEDFTLQAGRDFEKTEYGPKFPGSEYRPTVREDLENALFTILAEKIPEPLYCVVGGWAWTESKIPELPDYFNRF